MWMFVRAELINVTCCDQSTDPYLDEKNGQSLVFCDHLVLFFLIDFELEHQRLRCIPRIPTQFSLIPLNTIIFTNKQKKKKKRKEMADYETKEVSAIKALSVRKQVNLDDLQGLVGNTFITALEITKETGAEIAGKTLHLTHSVTDTHVDAEIIVPISKQIPDTASLKFVELPATKVAFVSVTGSYDNVFTAFDDLLSKVTPTGPVRTVYVVSPVDTTNESAWTTEVQAPI
jgi:effector-binding domain-containing protein